MASEKEKETIIKEPLPDDVLLGQGHYRHVGNQRLNKIVDARVTEYQNQSRPFKTYMAHDIIQRLRNKGVRFLKELAPKGWVVVKDDKEAREKVAQRFQYMMRTMAKNASSEEGKKEVKAPAKPKEKAGVPTLEFVPEPQPNLIWKGTTVKVPFLPVFHNLQRSSVLVDDDINAVAARLQECFSIIGVEESFNYEQVSSILRSILTYTCGPMKCLPFICCCRVLFVIFKQSNSKLKGPENLKIQMNLWKPLGGNKGVICELVNLDHNADIITFQKYCRYILEAATGLFDKYKHTLLQSRRLTTSSVQDQVTSYSANMAAVKKVPGKSETTDENTNKFHSTTPQVQPSMVRSASGRVREEAKKMNSVMDADMPGTKKESKRSLKRPSVKRLKQYTPALEGHVHAKMIFGEAGAIHKDFITDKLGEANQSGKRPTVKHFEVKASVSKNCYNLKRSIPAPEKESTTNSKEHPRTTGKRPSVIHFAPQTSIESNQESAKFHNPRTAGSKEPTTGIFATAFNRWETGIEPAQQRAEKAPAAESFASAFGRWESGAKVRRRITHRVEPTNWIGAAAKDGAERTTDKSHAAYPKFFTAGSESAPLGNRSFITKERHVDKPVTGAFPRDAPHPASYSNLAGKAAAPLHESRADRAAMSMDPINDNAKAIKQLSLSKAVTANTATIGPGDKGAYQPYAAKDGWQNADSNQEMKCDTGVEENRIHQQAAVADHATESMKRMSISSTDASYAGPRLQGDVFEAFPNGLWPNAIYNQEMKCDNSFDEDPITASSNSSQQSFIPSSFFGAAPPVPPSTLKRPNAPSPANSLGSHLSVEMRSLPSPSTSFNSQISIEICSIPSPCGSFNSKFSLGVNSLKNSRMDESVSPSMFHSDSSDNQRDLALPGALLNNESQRNREESRTVGNEHSQQNSVPPAIFCTTSVDGAQA